MIITIYILSISSLILVITIIILINHYEKWINELIRKQLKLRTQVDEAIKDLTELQETGYAIDTNIKSLINEIDSFEKESPNKEDSIKYELDFENKFTRIIEPNNTFKLSNSTNSDLVVSVIKIAIKNNT